MSRPVPLLVLALLAVAAPLTGCISLLPKEKPAQLYRFGDFGIPPKPPAAGQARFPVLALSIGFDRAAAGDAILTMTGEQAAYIRGSRWVTSAQNLFEAAVVRAFDADGGPARLMARGEATRPTFTLKLDVRAFETRYDHGQAAPPTVLVEVQAVLTAPSGGAAARERPFVSRITAGENRAGAIADAYDRAVRQVLGEVAVWVDARGEA